MGALIPFKLYPTSNKYRCNLLLLYLKKMSSQLTMHCKSLVCGAVVFLPRKEILWMEYSQKCARGRSRDLRRCPFPRKGSWTRAVVRAPRGPPLLPSDNLSATNLATVKTRARNVASITCEVYLHFICQYSAA